MHCACEIELGKSGKNVTAVTRPRRPLQNVENSKSEGLSRLVSIHLWARLAAGCQDCYRPCSVATTCQYLMHLRLGCKIMKGGVPKSTFKLAQDFPRALDLVGSVGKAECNVCHSHKLDR